MQTAINGVLIFVAVVVSGIVGAHTPDAARVLYQAERVEPTATTNYRVYAPLVFGDDVAMDWRTDTEIPHPPDLAMYGGATPDAVLNADESVCVTASGRRGDVFGQYVWRVEPDGTVAYVDTPFIASGRGQFVTWGNERRLLTWDHGSGERLLAFKLQQCTP